MKPSPFRYCRPATVAEALDLLDSSQDDVKILAGGQSLVPLMNFRLSAPDTLVDINNIAELAASEVTDGVVRLGALTRHRELISNQQIRSVAPLLPMVAPSIGHPQIRSVGTMGGSLAHADAAAELPAVMVALDATFILQAKSGQRRVAAQDFFQSYFTTVLQPNEILVAVEFPAHRATDGVGFREVAARHGDFALAGVAARLSVEDGQITDARLAALSVADTPVRLVEPEKVLRGQNPTTQVLAELRSAIQDVLKPVPAPKASAAYKTRTTAVLAARVVEQAWNNAQGRPE